MAGFPAASDAYDTFADQPEPQDSGMAPVDYNDDDGSSKSFAGSCMIMMIGCVLFPASLMVLGWNERNTVCQNHIMMMAEDKAVLGDCDSSAAVEGKFAFFSCPISNKGLEAMSPLTSFNLPGLAERVSFNSVAGAQKIEMYQCIESKEEIKTGSQARARETTRRRRSDSILPPPPVGLLQEKEEAALTMHDEEFGGSVDRSGFVRSEQDRTENPVSGDDTVEEIYKYRMGWSENYYNSKRFKATPQNVAASGCKDFVYQGVVNHNPDLPDRGDGHPIELGRQKIVATNVIAGPYTFADEDQMKKFTANGPIDLTAFSDKFNLSKGTDNVITAISPNTLAVHPGNKYYLASCRTDRLGCVRISYNASDASHISVLGHVGGAGIITPAKVPSKLGCDDSAFVAMYPTEMTKEQMITEMRGMLDMHTWAYRLVGLVAAWLSLYCCFDPIASAADMMADVLLYIPIFGELLSSMLEGVVTMFLCLISCGFGMSCGLLVIGIVWCGMRPMIGAPLLVAALTLFIIGFFAAQKSHRNPKNMRKDTQQKLSAQQMGLHSAPSYR